MGIDVNNVLSEEQQKITVVAIDRNTMTDIDMYDSNNNFLGTVQAQINLAHGYGDGREWSAQNQVKAVSKLMYELPIHGYCAINMAAVAMITI